MYQGEKAEHIIEMVAINERSRTVLLLAFVDIPSCEQPQNYQQRSQARKDNTKRECSLLIDEIHVDVGM